tara:strand:+ start:1191 stop:2582 length:1392 start_codon:yes stop_codon:yes gene_type:complete
MAYKFQVGGARMSGSLIQEGGLDVYDHSGNSKASISVAGALALSAGVTATTLSGSGALTVAGAATIQGDLLPLQDSASDLGSSAKQWAELHVDTGYIDALGAALDCDNNAMTNVNIDGGAIDGTPIGANSQAAAEFTTLSGSGAATLASTLTVQGNVLPLQDAGADLGSSSKEWKDLYIDGVAYIDSLQADQLGAALDANSQAITNVNIDSGAIDGTTIGASSQSSVQATTLSGSGVLQVGGVATFATNVLPLADGAADLGSSAKEWKDLYIDGVAYIDSLQADQLGAALDANNQAITNVDINSGAIDGTTIGVASPATISGSAISSSGVFQVGGNAQFNSTVMPARNGAQDLGSSVKKWDKIYVNTIVGADVAKDVEKVAAGGTISSGTDFALITSANGGTVTLPGASAGKTVTVKLSGGVGNLVLAAAGGDTVEAAASILLESTGSAVTLVAYDAVAWFVT